MENKISVITIIVSEEESVEKVNLLLHEYRNFVKGRFGLPLQDRGINVISVVIDAPNEITNSLSGKLGMLKGISSKVLTTK